MTHDPGAAPPPAVVPQPGWVAVVPFPSNPASRSFVSGEPDGDRLRIAYFRREHDGALVGRAWFGPGAEGPPGYAHGGSVAAVLDEAMGASAWMVGHTAVAARLTTDFVRMVPLLTDALFEAWVSEVNGRKILTKARLLDDDRQPLAEAEGLFIMLDRGRVEDLFGRLMGGKG